MFFFFCFFFSSITIPKWKENCDWNAGGNYIPSANYRVQVEGYFVTDGVCVCVCGCNYTQSSSLPKSTCRVVLNVLVGMLIGDRSAVQIRLRGLLLCTL